MLINNSTDYFNSKYNNQLAQLSLTQAHSNYLQKVKQNMPLSQESKVIELKYAAKCFGKMSEDERELAAYQLLLKIHSIRAWTIPASELMDILVTQFALKLSESYASVNEEEMMYAFRNCEPDVKDWGKALSLSLIDEVMAPYLEKRFELSRQEESVMNKPAMIEQKQELTNEDWEEWILDIRKYPLSLIPISCYDYLLRVGKINPTTKEKKEYLQNAMPIYATSIQEDLRQWNDFIKQKTDGMVTGKHLDSLITFSKRMIVSDYFKNNP